MSVQTWLKGLIAALVGGLANGITLVIADPIDFNLGLGYKKLLTVATVSALVNGAMYLKQSPVPPAEGVSK